MIRTNISSAVGDATFFSGSAATATAAMLSGVLAVCIDLFPGSRKGFLETGRGGSMKGEAGLWGPEGDEARLRNGLLEDRLSVSPADRGANRR